MKLARLREESRHSLYCLPLELAMHCPYVPLKRWFYRKRGTTIRDHVDISAEVFIDECSPGLVYISDGVQIGPRATILTHDRSRYCVSGKAAAIRAGRVTIESNAFIGACSVILPGVRIGPHAVVAAGSLVNRDVPAGSTVAGVPARVISRRRHRRGRTWSGIP